ncbi:MAG: RNA 2',3'-cyclic phosphodiesterase [Weeksellaceae bacterium]
MSYFIGIDLPKKTKQDLYTQLAPLADDYPEFSWIEWQNYHITLFQIGEFEPKHEPVVIEHVQQALFDVDPTMMYSMGTDMTIHKQITLYATFQRNKTIETIAERVEGLFPDDKKKKKEFLARIVIARYKIPSKQQYFHLKNKLAKMEIDVEFPVNACVLYKITPHQRNVEYEVVHSFPLGEE